MRHVQSLTLQGALITSVVQTLSILAISLWSSSVENLLAATFKFVRKTQLNTLPNASNLVHLTKSNDYKCPLCMKIQIDNHVLSKCGSPFVLARYRHRQDDQINAAWSKSTLRPEYNLHVPVHLLSDDYLPLSNIFVSKKPDIAVLGRSSVVTLEKTVCHETNLIRWKQY